MFSPSQRRGPPGSAIALRDKILSEWHNADLYSDPEKEG